MNARGLSCWLCISFLVSPFLCGCLPPLTVKAGPVAEAIDGTRGVPPGLPVVGTTTRLEMEQRYHAYQIDLGTQFLFWVHGYTSDRAYWDTNGRIWKSFNVVVTFDSSQVVKTLHTFPDESMTSEIASMLEHGLIPSLDLSAPIKISAERYPWTSDERYLRDDQIPVTVVLSPSSLTISATRAGRWVPPRSARFVTVVAPKEKTGPISMEYIGSGWPASDNTYRVGLWFRSKNELGDSIHFKTTFSNALTLARWMAQTPPAPPPTAQ